MIGPESNFLGHVYLATKPCGCLSAMSWDDVGREFAIAEFVSKCTQRGDKVHREARYKGAPFPPLKCPAHAGGAVPVIVEPSTDPVQPDTANSAEFDGIEKLAHRMAWRYKHSSDSRDIEYTFNSATLHQFVRAVAAMKGTP